MIIKHKKHFIRISKIYYQLLRGRFVSFTSENSDSNNMATLYITISSCRGSSMNTLVFQVKREKRPLREEKEKNAFMIVLREKLFSRGLNGKSSKRA